MLGAPPFAIKQLLLCEHCQLSRLAQRAGSVTASGVHGTDLQQITALSNKAGVNPQHPTISWLLAQGKAWLCGSRGRTPAFLL